MSSDAKSGTKERSSGCPLRCTDKSRKRALDRPQDRPAAGRQSPPWPLNRSRSRDRAILETFYSSGIRRAELIQLTLYDLDLKNGTLVIRQGKGNKDRYVPLGSRAIGWIRRYIEEVRPELVMEPDPGVLFLHEFGEAFSKNRLTDMVKPVRARHRHRQRRLPPVRHAQLSATEIYTHVTIAKLKEIHALTHPAERAVAAAPRRIEHRTDEHALLAALVAEDQRADPETDTLDTS